LQNTAVIRLIGDRLAWYPPGASDQPLWLDNDIAREKLLSTLSQRRMNLCFAVPGADARLLTLPLTAAEKKHITKSLPFMLEEQVAEDVEDLHFAHTPLGKDELAVALCTATKMAQWQEQLAAFPGVTQWLPEPLLLPWHEGEWCLVLEEDQAIVRLGQCVGFALERDMLEQVLLAHSGETQVPKSIIVYGSDQSSDTALLPAQLQELVQWRNGDLCAALMLSEGDSLNLNLLMGAYAPRLPFERWWRQWRAVAAVFAVAFGLQLASSYADYRNLSAENIALRTAVQDSYRTAFPKGAVVDAEKQLRRQLDALGGTGQASGFVSLMEQVGSVVSELPGTSIATINYNEKGDEMRLNVIAADFEGVERLRSRINEVGLEAIMESSSAQGEKVRARLRVGVRS
jgi:general secretion pathway protein L